MTFCGLITKDENRKRSGIVLAFANLLTKDEKENVQE